MFNWNLEILKFNEPSLWNKEILGQTKIHVFTNFLTSFQSTRQNLNRASHFVCISLLTLQVNALSDYYQILSKSFLRSIVYSHKVSSNLSNLKRYRFLEDHVPKFYHKYTSTIAQKYTLNRDFSLIKYLGITLIFK